MLIKIANSEFTLEATREVTAEQALSSQEITERFQKVASEIKKVAPKSGDFLYFIARGIHAMEHAAIDPVTRQFNPELGHIAHDKGDGTCATCGTGLLKNASGESVSGLWCQNSQVSPWVNQNGDAFPESELLADVVDPQDSSRTLKAYQTFIGKGLFTDHKSSEAEAIRGIILDAEYDSKSKGVDLLIALDKIAYPELARQVSAGYSAQVSMGTQVNYSLCNVCGNKAVIEKDYCSHVREGKALARAGKEPVYEINNGLNFIELSVVGNAADPRARIRTIVAHAQNIKKSVQANLESHIQEPENRLILESISRLETQISDLQTLVEPKSESNTASATEEIINKIASLEQQIKEIGGRFMAQKPQNKKAYMQGTVEPEVGKSFEMADKNYTQHWDQDIAQTGQDQTNGAEGLHGGYGLGSDEEVKKMYQRASADERKKIRRALLDKVSYMQGTVEPEVDKSFEMADKNYTQYWDDDVKQSGPDQTNGPDGLHGGYGMGSDEEVKKTLLRAKLRAKLEKSANPAKNKWTVFAGAEPILHIVAEEAYGDQLSAPAEEVDNQMSNQEWFDSKPYAMNLIQAIKVKGVEKVASTIEEARSFHKTAQMAAPEAAPVEAPAADVAPEMAAPVEEAAGEEMPAAPEMEASEGIRQAAEQIESAKDEILSLVESLEGEQALEGGALADEMGAASEELGEMAGEMGAADALPQAAASVYKKITRQALTNADSVLKKAEAFVNKYAKDEDDEKEEKLSKEDDKDQDGLADKDEKYLSEKAKEIEENEQKEAFTKEQLSLRKKARQAFAQQLYNLTDGDMIAEAHPEGGNTTTFPGQEEGRIETETEAQEKDIEVVNTLPRGELVARQSNRSRLIKAAEKIVASDAASIAQKATEAEDAQKVADEKKKQLADATKAEASTKVAEVDSEAKQYYKELASQSATGQGSDAETSTFYNELTQDFHGKKATAAVHDTKLKMKRAYAVALKRANLGQIEHTQDAIDADVDRLMNLDDESFTAFADVVENTKKVRTETTASASKQVRTAGAINVGVDQPSHTFETQLNKLPWS